MNRKVLEDCVNWGCVFLLWLLPEIYRCNRNIMLLAQTSHSCVRSSLQHLLRTAHITFPQVEKSIKNAHIVELLYENSLLNHMHHQHSSAVPNLASFNCLI